MSDNEPAVAGSRSRPSPLDGLDFSLTAKLGVLVVIGDLVVVALMLLGQQSNVSLVLTVPLALCASLAAAWWLGSGMTRPIRAMTEAAEAMADGDYRWRIESSSRDEVGMLARAFNDMAAQLGSVEQHRRDLIATVSHELRTPLTAQRAVLDNIVDGARVPDEATARTLLDQSERMSALVEELLDLSRLEAGLTTLNLQPLELDSLVESVIAEVALTHPGVRFKLLSGGVSAADTTVIADRGRLIQIVTNVLDNAARHGPPDGEVGVDVTTDADQWSLTVSDQGPGIPPDRRAAVFEKFAADSATGGTGLGLAIAQSLVDLHGGTIGVLDPQQSDGTGTRLQLVLPRVVDTAAAVASADKAAETALARASQQPDPTPRTAHGTSSIDAAFSRWWPERPLPRQVPVVVLSSLLGIVAAWGLIYPLSPEDSTSPGLGMWLVLVSAGALVWLVCRRRREPFTIACAVLSLALSLVFILRDDGLLMSLVFLLVPILVAAAVTGARSVGGAALACLSWVLAGVRGLPLLRRTLRFPRTERGWSIAMTVAVTVLMLTVFALVLALGDSVFAAWGDAALGGLFSSLWGLLSPLLGNELLPRLIFAFFVAGIVLAGTYLSLNPPLLPRNTMTRRPLRASWQWYAPIGALLGLFGIYFASQATAILGGPEYVQRTAGVTYASYARSGFLALMLATSLVVVVLRLAAPRAPRDAQRDADPSGWARAMMAALGLAALLLDGSALYRIGLYQGAFGYTEARLVAVFAELWLFIVVVAITAWAVRSPGTPVFRIGLLSAAVLLVVAAALNPQAWIAQQNLQRYQTTGKLDYYYLSSLSRDATATIMDSSLPLSEKLCLRAGYRTLTEESADLASWSAARAQSQALLAPYLTDNPWEGCRDYVEGAS